MGCDRGYEAYLSRLIEAEPERLRKSPDGLHEQKKGQRNEYGVKEMDNVERDERRMTIKHGQRKLDWLKTSMHNSNNMMQNFQCTTLHHHFQTCFIRAKNLSQTKHINTSLGAEYQ